MCVLMVGGVAGAQTSDAVITVMTFRSSEPGLGAKVADALREKLRDDIPLKLLQTIPTEDISNNLDSSGFSIDEALAPVDEQHLANWLRADMYVTGTISRPSHKDYQIVPRLILSRDLSLAQPLPVVQGDLDGVVESTVKSVREALKQFKAERKCMGAVSTGKVEEAVAAAREGVQAYPNGTIVRICQMHAWIQQITTAKTKADSIRFADSLLGVTQAILKVDSLSMPALVAQGGVVFKIRSDTAKEHRTLLLLARADSNDLTLVERVVNSLAEGGWVSDAVPLMKTLLDKNPGDPRLLHLAFAVHAAAQDWAGVVNTGTELARVDTAAVDSVYFARMLAAYDQQKQLQPAVDLLAQATAKFPKNGFLWMLYANRLRQAGQTLQAVSALRRVAEMNLPKVGGGPDITTVAYLQLADIYDKANEPDSLYAVLQSAAQPSSSANKEEIANRALFQGNNVVQALSKDSAAGGGAKARSELQNALRFLTLSNQLRTTPEAQFLIGVSNFQIMQSATQDAQDTKSCELSQLARQSYDAAQAGVQAGLNDARFQAPAKQMQEYMPKFLPAIQSQLQNFCK